MRKLSLRPILVSGRSVKKFDWMLELIERIDMKRLLQHWGWGSIRKWRGESDLSGREACADYFYYIPYRQRWNLVPMFMALRALLWPIRSASYAMGLNHDVSVPGWDDENHGDTHIDHTDSDEGSSVEHVN